MDMFTLRSENQKGMYGIPVAGLIAQALLEKRLNEEGYYQGISGAQSSFL